MQPANDTSRRHHIDVNNRHHNGDKKQFAAESAGPDRRLNTKIIPVFQHLPQSGPMLTTLAQEMPSIRPQELSPVSAASQMTQGFDHSNAFLRSMRPHS